MTARAEVAVAPGPRPGPTRLGGRLLGTVAVNVTVIVVNLGASVLVARTLGADGRGVFAALMALFMTSLVVAELGQSTAVTYFSASDPASVPATLTEGRRVMLAGGVALTAVGCGLALTVDLRLGLTPLEVSLAVGATVVNAVGAPYVFAAQAVALRTWNALRLVQPVLYTLAVAAAAVLGVLDVRFLVAALVASCALGLLVAWLAARRLGLRGGPVPRAHARAVRRFGLTTYAASLPLALTQYGDRLLLAPLVGAADLGRYAVALSVVGLTAPLANAVSSTRFPQVARLAGDRPARDALVRRTMTGTAGVLVAGTVAGCLAGQWLVPLVFGADFAGATWLLWAFAPTACLRALVLVASGLLRGLGRPGVPARAQLLVLVLVGAGTVPAALTAGLGGVAVVMGVAEAAALTVCLRALRRSTG